jgi:hypothetical protein
VPYACYIDAARNLTAIRLESFATFAELNVSTTLGEEEMT